MDKVNKLNKIKSLFEANRPIFNALGDEVRQELVLLIIDGNARSVQELADNIGLSRPTVSHHLKILKDVGIIIEQKIGAKTIYRSNQSSYVASVGALVEAVKSLEPCKEDNQCQNIYKK